MEEKGKLTCGYRRKGNIVRKPDGSVLIDSYVPAYIQDPNPRGSAHWNNSLGTAAEYYRGSVRNKLARKIRPLPFSARIRNAKVKPQKTFSISDKPVEEVLRDIIFGSLKLR